MTQEEKARRYDEALEIAHKINCGEEVAAPEGWSICEVIFPQLKESEDERIRKRLITIYRDIPLYSKVIDDVRAEDIIKWLEKQGEKSQGKTALEIWKDMRLEVYQQASGNRHEPNYSDDTTKMFYLNDIDEIMEKISEQKPIDKVEPKFHEGDWIIWDNKVSCHVDNIYQGKESLMYIITDTNNMTRSYSVKGFEKNARLWNIADAKDGDVLVEDSCIFIVQKLDDNSSSAKTYFTLYNDGDFDEGSILYFDIDSTKPATKEQSELLFQKMKEAGYTFDFEKKELREIEQNIVDNEDERIRKDITRCLEYSSIKPDRPINPHVKTTMKDALSWLEKQSNTNETTNSAKIVQGVLRGAAINLITWIDYNAAEGNTCLSNMECKDIGDALVSGDWDKIYGYIKKKLEKQEEL